MDSLKQGFSQLLCITWLYFFGWCFFLLTEEKDGEGGARKTWCKLICWQFYLFDWLITLSFSCFTKLWRAISFSDLIECLILFHCHRFNCMTEMKYSHFIGWLSESCNNTILRVHFIATCLMSVFTIMNCISKLMDDGWFTIFHLFTL